MDNRQLAFDGIINSPRMHKVSKRERRECMLSNR